MSGRDFSRAVSATESMLVLAPEGMLFGHFTEELAFFRSLFSP